MKEQYIKIDKDGNKFYYSNKQMTILHREDGPACEHADGTKSWWLNGKRHRIDGPAVEWDDGHKEWWANGIRLSQNANAFKKSTDSMKPKKVKSVDEGKLIEIAGVKYILIKNGSSYKLIKA